MSLTSYRAAPPRAKRIWHCQMTRLLHGFAVMRVPEQNPVGLVSFCGTHDVLIPDIRVLQTDKAANGGLRFRLRAEDVMRRLSLFSII